MLLNVCVKKKNILLKDIGLPSLNQDLAATGAFYIEINNDRGGEEGDKK